MKTYKVRLNISNTVEIIAEGDNEQEALKDAIDAVEEMDFTPIWSWDISTGSIEQEE